MRLDSFLFENGYAHSRSFAKSLIIEKKVSVGGKTITKPSFEVDEDAEISIINEEFYVSRGAYKLQGAKDAFDFSICGRYCIDVGASSGGFTDYLLKNGAEHVIAVDSGSDQLAASLRNDPRVTSIENYNARYLRKEDFDYEPTLAVMDVSFISATYIMPALYQILAPGADFICLIKPQFEVGKAFVGKGGIVKDSKARLAAVDKVVDFAKSIGFISKGVTESPIHGGDGNIEFLAHFVKI